ncbi:unnamed protein product, partial [Schistocephalus solidus]|uniref:Uncharacterized protein n=1 Tax=Schistocephalus solidus TaxID=70667 RepID=A0A183SVD1_SCHSO
MHPYGTAGGFDGGVIASETDATVDKGKATHTSTHKPTPDCTQQCTCACALAHPAQLFAGPDNVCYVWCVGASGQHTSPTLQSVTGTVVAAAAAGGLPAIAVAAGAKDDFQGCTQARCTFQSAPYHCLSLPHSSPCRLCACGGGIGAESARRWSLHQLWRFRSGDSRTAAKGDCCCTHVRTRDSSRRLAGRESRKCLIRVVNARVRAHAYLRLSGLLLVDKFCPLPARYPDTRLHSDPNSSRKQRRKHPPRPHRYFCSVTKVPVAATRRGRDGIVIAARNPPKPPGSGDDKSPRHLYCRLPPARPPAPALFSHLSKVGARQSVGGDAVAAAGEVASAASVGETTSFQQ